MEHIFKVPIIILSQN